MSKNGSINYGEYNKHRKLDLLYEAGFGFYPKVIARMIEVSCTDKQVLYVIMERIRDNGSGASFPSVTTMARESGCSRRTVQKSIHIWKKLGVIDWIAIDGHSNRYILNEIPEWIINKYSKREEMGKKDIEKTIQKSLDKTRKIHAEREKKRMGQVVFGKNKAFGKTRKSVEYLDYQKEYARLFLKKYPEELLPTWTGKEANQTKSFIKGVGSLDVAVAITKYIFKNWGDLCDQWKIDPDGYPTLSIIMGFGKSLATKVMKNVKKSELKYEDEEGFDLIEH